jgi:asparagine synthase (glutamine-hydrolysing)
VGLLVRTFEGRESLGERRFERDGLLFTVSESCSIHETADVLCVVDGWLCASTNAALELCRAYRSGEVATAATQDGHYVAVLHDRSRRETHLLADRTGFGHAYYWSAGGQFAFGTDAREVAPSPAVSPASLALYLTFQYVPPPYCIFKGLKRPLPGSVITWRDRQLVERSVAAFPDPCPRLHPGVSPVEEDERLEELLTSTLSDRIVGAERLGMTLSGGMDTSANAVILATRLERQPVAFTASFSEAGYDESNYAALVARKFGFEHFVVPIRPEAIEVLPELARAFETPNADQAAFATHLLAAVAAELSCTHLVTGEGGDEIVGVPMSRHDGIQWLSLPRDSMGLARFYIDQIGIGSAAGRQALARLLEVPEDLAAGVLATIYQDYRAFSEFDRILFGQWRTWLTDGVYMKDRRVFGGAGIECLLPFADPRVMNFIASLPAQARFRALDGKSLLRASVGKYLPNMILERTKHKFWIPFAEWFRGPLRGYLRDTLLSNSQPATLLGLDLINNLILEHEKEIADNSGILWALCFLDAWLDRS